MRNLIYLLFIILLCSLPARAQITTHVYNGEETTHFPYTGLLKDKKGQCTATAFPNSSCVITAAHCVAPDQKFIVDSLQYTINHYSYIRHGNKVADVVIGKLNSKVRLNTEYSLRLPQVSDILYYGDNITVVGYGLSGGNKPFVSKRREGVMYFSHYLTDNTLDKQITSHTMQLFPFPKDEKQNVCAGDSGGPVFYGDKLVGITSAGYHMSPPRAVCRKGRRWSKAAKASDLTKVAKSLGLHRKFRNSYKVANNYCKQLGPGWRLPYIKEVLKSKRKPSSKFIWTRGKKTKHTKPAVKWSTKKIRYIGKWATVCDREIESEAVSLIHYLNEIYEITHKLGCFSS